MNDEKIIHSYVWHKGERFFVSTIERDSSAMIESPPPRYAETIAWQWPEGQEQRGDQVYMAGDGPAFRQHGHVCRLIYDHGANIPEDDEE